VANRNPSPIRAVESPSESEWTRAVLAVIRSLTGATTIAIEWQIRDVALGNAFCCAEDLSATMRGTLAAALDKGQLHPFVKRHVRLALDRLRDGGTIAVGTHGAVPRWYLESTNAGDVCPTADRGGR
jgi:hypothetical protein